MLIGDREGEFVVADEFGIGDREADEVDARGIEEDGGGGELGRAELKGGWTGELFPLEGERERVGAAIGATGLSFGEPQPGGLTPEAVAATDAAFAAIAYVTSALSLLSGVIAWFTLPRKLGT